MIFFPVAYVTSLAHNHSIATTVGKNKKEKTTADVLSTVVSSKVEAEIHSLKQVSYKA